jgi:hypothetical protein
MPVERHVISRSQLCELLGVDPARFIDVAREPAKREDQRQGKQVLGWVIVMEEEPVAQTTGSIPPLYGGWKKKPKGTKKTC